eukprot:12453764-Prorocentrum_lima.AAC.1
MEARSQTLDAPQGLKCYSYRRLVSRTTSENRERIILGSLAAHQSLWIQARFCALLRERRYL